MHSFLFVYHILISVLKIITQEKEEDQKYEQYNDNKLTIINIWT